MALKDWPSSDSYLATPILALVRTWRHRYSYLADEYVAGGIDGLGRSGAHRALHDPGQLEDDDLHDAQVVEHRDDAAQEDHHRHHLYTSSSTRHRANVARLIEAKAN